MKIVINKCYGGFSLSDKAYEKLIEWGIPVRKYIPEKRNPQTGLFKKEPRNDGEIIFDRTLEEESFGTMSKEKEIEFLGRYWETWIDKDARNHPLIVKVVEELGKDADGKLAKLEVVEIPDGVKYEIDEYDGIETIHEVHRMWA